MEAFARGSSSGPDGLPEPQSEYLVKSLVLPTLAVGALSFLAYPFLCQAIALLLDSVTLDVVKGDVSQFMQNFFNFNGLLFSFFASATYSILYAQQESVYLALFSEVTEARSLLEQITLVSQARPSYKAMLRSMEDYVQDLVMGLRLQFPPAAIVSAKPIYDPLENILYLTSVGLPSVVYDTVRSLREARGTRLGATQRKLPQEHFVLLNFLGVLELLAFPLLGAGISGYEPAAEATAFGHVLWYESVVFAGLAMCTTLTLQMLQDLRSPVTGLYSLDGILDGMVQGLKDEVDARIRSIPKDIELPMPTQFDGDRGEFIVPTVGGQSQKERLMKRLFGDENAEKASLDPESEGNASTNYFFISAGVGLLAALAFPFVVTLIKGTLSAGALQSIREDNNAQWLQNFFTGIGFIFSLFVAETFSFLYRQQEAIYLALYAEVSEAKALLEQLALICQTRPSYSDMLRGLQRYVKDDLERLDKPPAQLLAMREGGDPLEIILYLTSVGVPSQVYQTVVGLRQVRGARLGATQQKLPDAHFALLTGLGVLELAIFPLLAAGCADLDKTDAWLPGHITFFHAVLFGLMSTAVALTLKVLRDIWSPVGETYNVRNILRTMVSGLDAELSLRLASREEQKKYIKTRTPKGAASAWGFPVAGPSPQTAP